jgi:hypothetical protein
MASVRRRGGPSLVASSTMSKLRCRPSQVAKHAAVVSSEWVGRRLSPEAHVHTKNHMLGS